MRPIKERLAEQCIETANGCIEWTGYRMPYGYGVIYWNGANRLTHRVSYELYHGNLDSNAIVCHRCDNPPCVKPEHLFAGTHADNVRDKVRKGRQPTGPRKTHCRNGHAYSPENVLMVLGKYRRCKICNSDSRRRWQEGKAWNPKRGKNGGYE